MAILNLAGILTRLCADLSSKFSKVSIQRILTDGTTIAIVTVDGVQHIICAPTQPKPAALKPRMDGTAAFGSSTYYAREDHIHPTDTSRQEKLVSGTNIKSINGNSLLGSGDLTISGGGGASDSIMATLHMSSERSGSSIVYSIPADEISALYNNTPVLLYITGANYSDPFCGCYRRNKRWSRFGYDPSVSAETVSVLSDSSSASGLKVTLLGTVLTYNSSKARYEYTVGAEPE